MASLSLELVRESSSSLRACSCDFETSSAVSESMSLLATVAWMLTIFWICASFSSTLACIEERSSLSDLTRPAWSARAASSSDLVLVSSSESCLASVETGAAGLEPKKPPKIESIVLVSGALGAAPFFFAASRVVTLALRDSFSLRISRICE